MTAVKHANSIHFQTSNLSVNLQYSQIAIKIYKSKKYFDEFHFFKQNNTSVNEISTNKCYLTLMEK